MFVSNGQLDLIRCTYARVQSQYLTFVFRLPYRGKITYNLLSHNRIMAMTHKDYFFVTEAEESTIYEGIINLLFNSF